MEIEEIIAKEMSGDKLNSMEVEQLKSWLIRSKANRKLYTQIVLIHNSSDQMKKTRRGELTSILNTTPPYRQSKKSMIGFSMRIAASLLVLAVSMAIILNIQFSKSDVADVQPSRYMEKETLPGQRITTVLADGTIVKLNANSKLVFPSSFQGNFREVDLVGEAFFNVAKNSKKPFIIHSKNMQVRVVGTSFTVSSYENEHQSVAVKTGKVVVNNTISNHIETLNALDQVAFVSNGTIQKGMITDPDLTFGWVDQIFVLNDAPFEAVASAVEKWFGVSLIINTSIKKEIKYSTKRRNPSLKEVMESLALLYDFTYEINGKEVMIK